MKDLSNIVILATGFIAGSIICRFFDEHLAYQGHEVNPISQDDIDFYKTKQIVEDLARQRGIPVTIVRLQIKKIIANYNKKHPNGHHIPFTYAVPVPQPYFSGGQHYDTIPNYEGGANVTLAPERKYLARQPNNVFDIWA